jgi:hypothetical protein
VIGFANETAAGTASLGGDPVNGVPPQFLGVPLAISFGIGEAY